MYGLRSTDIPKILNLMYTWKFILDKDVLNYGTGYHIPRHIANGQTKAFILRVDTSRASKHHRGTSYPPPLPIESIAKECIDDVIHDGDNVKSPGACVGTQPRTGCLLRKSRQRRNHRLYAYALLADILNHQKKQI